MTLLALQGVRVRRRGRTILDQIELTVAPGEIVGLIGPNGAGKTTLIRAALGLIPATGAIALGGTPLARLAPAERARRAAYLPQEREIAWALAVETLVALGRAPHRRPGAPLGHSDRAAIEAALALTDTARLRHRPATELSGGERARALIARALAQEAALLMADEPTAGLDPVHALALVAVFRDLAARGRGVLTALHDLTLAARACTRLVLMAEGSVAASGPPEAVLTPARLGAVYGITAHISRDAGGPLIWPTGLAL